MFWYYASANGRKGPVDSTEMALLAEAGTIKAETPVWREGLADWIPYKDSLNPTVGTAPGIIGSASVICAVCRKNVPGSMAFMLNNVPVCHGCQPLAVQRLREGGGGGEAEEIRKKHISHESTIRTIGLMHMLGGIVFIVSGLSVIILLLMVKIYELSTLAAAIVLGVGIFKWKVGRGLRRLDGEARSPAIGLSVIGLLSFPLGTMLNAIVLYLLTSQKGKMVFSYDYEKIIAQTPHVKNRTSPIVWALILLFLLLLLIGGGVLLME